MGPRSSEEVGQLKEEELPGPIPRYEVPGWRERFGIVAGITGRGEGDTPFDLGLWTGQPVGEVMSRWRALRQAEGFARHVLGNQVHQARVAQHERPETGWLMVEGVDGHATREADLMLYVTVADCIPVYLAHPGSGTIGLLHAGWRGTAAGILEQGIQVLSHMGNCPPGEIVMHCGVGICGECYEVGSEVMDGLGLNSSGPGPYHADIRGVLADQARRLGVREITVSSWCSAHDRPRFFSHRASRGTDGRMVAFLGRP